MGSYVLEFYVLICVFVFQAKVQYLIIQHNARHTMTLEGDVSVGRF